MEESVLFLDGNAIAGNEPLVGSHLPALVLTLSGRTPELANISVVADLSSLTFFEERTLAEQIAKAGGVLCELSPGQTFRQFVDENRDSVEKASAFVPAPVLNTEVPNQPPPRSMYAVHYMKDAEFDAFREALAAKEDAKSVAY